MREHIRNGPCHPNDLRSCLSIYLSSNNHNQPRPHPIIVIALPTKISNLVSVSPHPRPIRPNGKSLEPHKAVSSSGEALSISLFCNHCIFVVLTSFLPLKVTQGNTFIRYIGLFPFLIWQHSKKSLHQLQSLSRCFVALPVNYH